MAAPASSAMASISRVASTTTYANRKVPFSAFTDDSKNDIDDGEDLAATMNALAIHDEATTGTKITSTRRVGRETKTTNAKCVISDADYKCQHLCYHAWLQPPDVAYRTKEDMSTMLSSHSVMDISHTRLPLFVPPKRPISFTPSPKESGPESKPNLISGLCAFLLNEVRRIKIKASSSTTAADVMDIDRLLKCLSRVTAFTSRHPLKRVLTTTHEPSKPWSVYACFVSGTLFVERGDFYNSLTGVKGTEFEERVKEQRDNRLLHRVYAVVSARLANLNVVLTGEANAVDENGDVVEIRTIPAWVRGDKRGFQNWLQSALAGVGTVAVGKFTSDRISDPQARVFFHPANVQVLSLDQYAERNHLTCTPSARALAFKVYHRFISWVRVVCEAAPGQVFEIRYNPSARSVTASPDDKFPFPVDDEVVHAALHAVLQHFKAPASALKDTTEK